MIFNIYWLYLGKQNSVCRWIRNVPTNCVTNIAIPAFIYRPEETLSSLKWQAEKKSDLTTITNIVVSFFLFIYMCYLIGLISAFNLLKPLMLKLRHKLN
jgi:hypothetical protein